MAGYGTASRSMVYYPVVNNFTTATGGFIDTSFNGRSIFRQVISPVYFLLHNTFGDELKNLDSMYIQCNNNPIYFLIGNPNAGWSIATQVLLAFHILFVNILLINLLIAMFRYSNLYALFFCI